MGKETGHSDWIEPPIDFYQSIGVVKSHLPNSIYFVNYADKNHISQTCSQYVMFTQHMLKLPESDLGNQPSQATSNRPIKSNEDDALDFK